VIAAVARLLLAAAGAAFAVWLLPASIHIAAWPASGPIRIAYLAPLSRLWLTIALAVVAAIALTTVLRRNGHSLPSVASAISPLLLLWLWLLPYLPWLPDRAPLVLVFAGPLRWGVVITAVVGLVVNRIDVRAAGRRLPVPRRRLVFIVSFAMYATLGTRYTHGAGLGGDEPHYLIITQSLILDGDLDIANNHARRDYRTYFPGELRPDFLRRGLRGEIYSIHAAGLPALLIPAFAVAGAVGAVVFMALLGACAAVAIFDAAAIVSSPVIAGVVWIAACFSVPFVPHAWLIYPEMAGALVVAWAVLWLLRPPPAPTGAFLHGLALASLPWLHTKFALLAALFGAFDALRLWPRIRSLLAFALPIAVSGLAWLFSFRVMYGVFDPEAPYGSYTRMFVLAKNIPRGTLGLLFDQKFGLLVFSPIYVLVVVGAWIMLRDPRRRWLALGLLTTAGAFWVSTTRLYMWWGGSSAPARFLVPTVPLLTPMIAVAIAQCRDVFARGVIALTLAVTIGTAVLTLSSSSGQLLYSRPHGVGALVTYLQGSAPFDASLPSFTEENWQAPLRSLWPWLAGFLVAVASGAWLVRIGRIRSVFWSAATCAIVFVICGSVFAAMRGPTDRPAIVVREQLALMQDYDPTRTHGVDVTHGRRLSNDDVLAAMRLELRRTANEPIANPRVLEGPFELPEGRYEARVWSAGPAAARGVAFVALADQIVLARAPLDANPASIRFDLPIRTPAFVGVDTLDTAGSVGRIDIAPVALLPRSQRQEVTSHVVEPIGGTPSSFMAYSDENTYPEGGVFWTRDTQEGTVVIATRGAGTVRLILHVGPPGGPVVVAAGAKRIDIDLKPNETREIDVAVPSGSERMRLSVRAARSFRPSAVDPKSNDDRLLGCQVRPLLIP
jgi:hypothetical protein